MENRGQFSFALHLENATPPERTICFEVKKPGSPISIWLTSNTAFSLFLFLYSFVGVLDCDIGVLSSYFITVKLTPVLSPKASRSLILMAILLSSEETLFGCLCKASIAIIQGRVGCSPSNQSCCSGFSQQMFNVVLVSESAVCIHISPPLEPPSYHPPLPSPSRSSQREQQAEIPMVHSSVPQLPVLYMPV